MSLERITEERRIQEQMDCYPDTTKENYMKRYKEARKFVRELPPPTQEELQADNERLISFGAGAVKSANSPTESEFQMPQALVFLSDASDRSLTTIWTTGAGEVKSQPSHIVES